MARVVLAIVLVASTILARQATGSSIISSCRILPGVAMQAAAFRTFATADATPEICCNLCDADAQCQAWMAVPSNASHLGAPGCNLFNSTTQQAAEAAPGIVSGIVGSTQTHYGNPLTNVSCLPDETKLEGSGGNAVCAPDCPAGACPVDTPSFLRGRPSCVPTGNNHSCVLPCASDPDCGLNANCSGVAADGTKYCAYAGVALPQVLPRPRYIGCFQDDGADRDLPVSFCSNGTIVNGARICAHDNRSLGHAGSAASSLMTTKVRLDDLPGYARIPPPFLVARGPFPLEVAHLM